MATTAKTKKTKTNTDSKKVKELEAQVAQLTEMVKMLTNTGLLNNSTQVNTSVDRDVTFVSLCNNILNLSTEPSGGGTVYTFMEFGEEQSIPYSDARQIIRNNKKFIKEGKCYIADDDIIEVEHLKKDYEKLLDKDSLLDLLNQDRNAFSNLFDKMTNSQKETFRDIIISRLSKDRNSVDMNIVQKVNDALNTDVLKDMEFGKSLFANED